MEQQRTAFTQGAPDASAATEGQPMPNKAWAYAAKRKGGESPDKMRMD